MGACVHGKTSVTIQIFVQFVSARGVLYGNLRIKWSGVGEKGGEVTSEKRVLSVERQLMLLPNEEHAMQAMTAAGIREMWARVCMERPPLLYRLLYSLLLRVGCCTEIYA